MPTDADNGATNRPPFLAPADRRQLFVHDTSVMNDPSYNRSYSIAQHHFAERALWLAEPDDMVVVASPIEPAYLDYLQAQRLGTRHAPIVPPAEAGVGITTRMLADPAWLYELNKWAHDDPRPFGLSTFGTTSETVRLAHHLCRRFEHALPVENNADVMANANRKVYVRTGLAREGLSQIPGSIVQVQHDKAERTKDVVWGHVKELLSQTGKVIIRANYSSGGEGNFLAQAHDQERLTAWLADRQCTDQFLVEVYLPWQSSPNVQYWIEACGAARHVQTTDQRMSAPITYNGNRYPAETTASARLHQHSAKVAAWLSGQGVRGLVGIDYLETINPGGDADFKFVEVNARFNGSSYATAIWYQINRIRIQQEFPTLSHWQLYRGIKTRIRNFAELQARTDDLLYQPGADRGVIPYWTGALRHGLCSCLTLANSFDELSALETEFLSRVENPPCMN